MTRLALPANNKQVRGWKDASDGSTVKCGSEPDRSTNWHLSRQRCSHRLRCNQQCSSRDVPYNLTNRLRIVRIKEEVSMHISLSLFRTQIQLNLQVQWQTHSNGNRLRYNRPFQHTRESCQRQGRFRKHKHGERSPTSIILLAWTSIEYCYTMLI